jgi:hypothetical protein
MSQSYDIIGDIHGHAKPLRALLEKLGYREVNGAYAHPERKVIFLGDFVDRGPRIREVLQIVRGMTDSGAAKAIQGNHEFNALSYSTTDGKGDFLRPHNDKNTKQHRATLDQIAGPHPQEWAGWLDWFRTLPLFLDLGGLRAVHAAWDDQAVALARDVGPLTAQKLALLLADKKSPHGRMKEILLNGLELTLPGELAIADKEGEKRSEIRTAWWLDFRGKTYQDIVFPAADGAPPVLLSPALAEEHEAYPPDAPPIFMGHYWLPPVDPPILQAKNVAIIDYSVAKDGNLVAYRWDGEKELDPKKFVVVPNTQKEGSPK